MLQADSKEMYNAWIMALQKGIGAAIQRTSTSDLDTNSLETSAKIDLRQVMSSGAVGKNNNFKKSK